MQFTSVCVEEYHSMAKKLELEPISAISMFHTLVKNIFGIFFLLERRGRVGIASTIYYDF